MMSGFRHWLWNSNRITFVPLFGKKKLPKIVKICFISAKRGSNVVRNEFLRPESESSHHLGPFRLPFVIICKFLFFTSHVPTYYFITKIIFLHIKKSKFSQNTSAAKFVTSIRTKIRPELLQIKKSIGDVMP